jgi:hypothetical protein
MDGPTNVPLEWARLDLSQALLSITIQLVGIGYGTEELAGQLACVREQALALNATEPHETPPAISRGASAACPTAKPQFRARRRRTSIGGARKRPWRSSPSSPALPPRIADSSHPGHHGRLLHG